MDDPIMNSYDEYLQGQKNEELYIASEASNEENKISGKGMEMQKLLEAIGQYGVQCSETKELSPPQYLLDALDILLISHQSLIKDMSFTIYDLENQLKVYRDVFGGDIE
jgi:hypothetical protein